MAKKNERIERRLILIGDGETRQEDCALALRSQKQRDVMIVNKVVHDIKEYDHWVSYHSEVFGTVTSWKGLTHSNNADSISPDIIWKHENAGGTSALFALVVAKKLGYNKIVICGCPLSGNYGHETVVYPWKLFIDKNIDWCRNSVRSYSGKTNDMFGEAKGWW